MRRVMSRRSHALRTRQARSRTAVVPGVIVFLAIALFWLASSVQAAPLLTPSAARSPVGAAHRAAPGAVAGVNLSSPADTGSSALTNLGAAGWKVLTTATATQTGKTISTPGFSTTGWLRASTTTPARPAPR